jgi:hypothetical protein
MAEHDHQRGAEGIGSVLHGAHGRRINHVAGVAGDEQLTKAEATEQQLGRHPAVRAAYNDGPRLLVRGEVGARLCKISDTHLRIIDIACVALFQGRQGLVGRDASLAAVGSRCEPTA